MCYAQQIAVTLHTAMRKVRHCIWCREQIPLQEKYVKDVSTFEGEFQVVYFHPECKEAAQKSAERSGDGCVLYTGCETRGKPSISEDEGR